MKLKNILVVVMALAASLTCAEMWLQQWSLGEANGIVADVQHYEYSDGGGYTSKIKVKLDTGVTVFADNWHNLNCKAGDRIVLEQGRTMVLRTILYRVTRYSSAEDSK